MYDQKDIVLIPFPYSDLTGAKQRPALIMSNEKLNRTEDRICCLVTSKRAKNSVAIAAGSLARGKLLFKSWVKPHRLFTINEKIVKKRLCTVNNNVHDRVLNGITDYLKRK